jgi:hypothetical protein
MWTTAGLTFFDLSPMVWITTLHPTAQYGQT